MKYIRIRKSKKYINFYFYDVLLGYAYREVDGFYAFIFNDNKGCWSSYILKEIAEILDDLNKEYSNQLDQYFNNEKLKL